MYCDIETDGGGWTKITAAVDASVVDTLRGGASSGRQMIKCSDAGSAHIISPLFTTDWSWGSATVTKVSGDWIVDGAPQFCGDHPEIDDTGCATWWGVGCSNGPGFNAKFYPGILDTAGGTCAGPNEGHTQGPFDICDDVNDAAYSIFVRANP